MSTRIVCPHCGEKLVLRNPVSDRTKVKCGECKKTFSAKTGPDGVVVTGGDSSGAMQPLVAPAGSRSRNSDSSGEIPVAHEPFSPGLAAAGVAALVVLSLAGFMLGQKPPPISPPPVVSDTVTPRASNTSAKLPIETADRPKSPGREPLPRPTNLVGVWELQDAKGDTIELSTDGSVRVAATLLNATPLSLSTRWHVVNQSGPNFDLELGGETGLRSNHHLRVVQVDDKTLKLVKYSNTLGVDARERTLVLRK